MQIAAANFLNKLWCLRLVQLSFLHTKTFLGCNASSRLKKGAFTHHPPTTEEVVGVGRRESRLFKIQLHFVTLAKKFDDTCLYGPSFSINYLRFVFAAVEQLGEYFLLLVIGSTFLSQICNFFCPAIDAIWNSLLGSTILLAQSKEAANLPCGGTKLSV